MLQFFTYSFLGSIFILTGFGNITVWSSILFIVVCISFFVFFVRSVVAGFLLGGVAVVLFSYTHAATAQSFAGSYGLQGVITGIRTSTQYELSVDQAKVLVQTAVPVDVSIGTQVYVLFDHIQYTQAKPVSYNRYGFDMHGLFTQQFSFEKWLYMKGYAGSLYAKKITIIHESDMQATSTYIRSIITQKYGSTKEGALLYGMLFGGRVGMHNDDYQAFIDSGLVHIIAVSGSNIMMVIITFHYLLFFIPLMVRRLLIGCIVVWYLYICGFDSSLIRATIMALVQLLVLFGGSKISFHRLLMYTITLMLLYNPYFLLYDLGFLLSIAALLGIRVVPILYAITNKFIKEYLLPPLFAFMAVVPVLLLFIGKINLLSFLTTLLIGPFLPGILLVGSVSLFINNDMVLTLGQYGLSFIYKVSQYGQQFGIYMSVSGTFASIVVVFCTCFMYYCLVLYSDYLSKKDVV